MGSNGNIATDLFEGVTVLTGMQNLPETSQGNAPSQQDQGQNAPSSPQEAFSQGMGIQRTGDNYATAMKVQKPRDLDKIVAQVLYEADHAGEEFYWSWQVNDKRSGGKKMVEGESIGLAYCLARYWGNCIVDVDVEVVGQQEIFKARFVDLETGYNTVRVFRQKFNPFGSSTGYQNSRMDDMNFQAAQSKALRNVILAGTPKWLAKEAMNRAKRAELNLIDKIGLHQARNQAVKFFQGYGVEVPSLEKYLRKKKEDWTREDIGHLRGVGTQIREGSNPEDFFDMTLSARGETVNTQTGEVTRTEAQPQAKEQTQPAPEKGDNQDQGGTSGKQALDDQSEAQATGPEYKEPIQVSFSQEGGSGQQSQDLGQNQSMTSTHTKEALAKFGFPFEKDFDNALAICITNRPGAVAKLGDMVKSGMDRQGLKHWLMEKMSPGVTDAKSEYGLYSCDPKRTPKFCFGQANSEDRVELFGMDCVDYVRKLFKIPEPEKAGTDAQASSQESQDSGSPQEGIKAQAPENLKSQPRTIECPDKDDMPVSRMLCDTCSKREGCPAHEDGSEA